MQDQNGITQKEDMINLSATSLIGTPVVNNEGEDLGEVHEIMLDTTHGKIAYVVLSFGGFMGLGDKLFAIPMEAFTVDTENEELILDIDKEKLTEAPGFDPEEWPGNGNYDYHKKIYDYYGFKPYWSK